jgi:hypothetical protein
VQPADDRGADVAQPGDDDSDLLVERVDGCYGFGPRDRRRRSGFGDEIRAWVHAHMISKDRATRHAAKHSAAGRYGERMAVSAHIMADKGEGVRGSDR